MMQVLRVTSLTPASTLEQPVVDYGNEFQLEFVHYDPRLLPTVKPGSERECDMEAVKETAD